MAYDDEPLRIVRVQLAEESLKSHRVLNDGNPDLYSVIVGLSRPADEYERKELADFHIIREDEDGMWALIRATTLENIPDNIDKYNAALDSAVENARETREAAEAEDERLHTLASELNKALLEEHRKRMGSA
jgi:hypothetical protein